MQLACETRTILIWKTYIPFSDLSYSELVTVGLIGNHLFFFFTFLELRYLVD